MNKNKKLIYLIFTPISFLIIVFMLKGCSPLPPLGDDTPPPESNLFDLEAIYKPGDSPKAQEYMNRQDLNYPYGIIIKSKGRPLAEGDEITFTLRIRNGNTQIASKSNHKATVVAGADFVSINIGGVVNKTTWPTFLSDASDPSLLTIDLTTTEAVDQDKTDTVIKHLQNHIITVKIDVDSTTPDNTEIFTWRDLENMLGTNRAGSFHLKTDVIFPEVTSGPYSYGFDGFDVVTGFTGSVDGDNGDDPNFKIVNFATNKGMFENFTGTIKNINFVNAKLFTRGAETSSGGGYGIIANKLQENAAATHVGTIENVSINITSYEAAGATNGGAVGTVVEGEMLGVSTSGVVGSVTNKKASVGGLVGEFQGGEVYGYSTANVTGTSKVGGLVGVLAANTTINKAYLVGYASGNINATDSSPAAGGLVGELSGKGGRVIGYYTDGQITAPSSSSGYIVGNVLASIIVTNVQEGTIFAFATHTASKKDTNGVINNKIIGSNAVSGTLNFENLKFAVKFPANTNPANLEYGAAGSSNTAVYDDDGNHLANNANGNTANDNLRLQKNRIAIGGSGADAIELVTPLANNANGFSINPTYTANKIIGAWVMDDGVYPRLRDVTDGDATLAPYFGTQPIGKR